jgi:S-adenosylmethionine:tRNA ribosyltransferase-isomerase
MRKPVFIPISDFDYHLPDDRIAKYPLANREDSKLLVYQNKNIESKLFSQITDLLDKNDLLIFNSTRVIQARLNFKKSSGAKIEIFCLQPHSPIDYQQAFSSFGPVDFICLVGNAKKWKEGKVYSSSFKGQLEAEKLGKIEDKYVIRFRWTDSNLTFSQILEKSGSTPIPPYLKRPAEKNDANSYQTVYAEDDGSVAAPTAGLHFSDDLIGELRNKGIAVNNLTLHVGAGTFIPVKKENAVEHKMHAEFVTVNRELLESLLEDKRRIAVGTTSTRSLESIYWLGVKAHQSVDFTFESLYLDQWEAYDLNQEISLEDSIETLISLMKENDINSFEFSTRIMITPGYQLRVIDALFTNFHQPKSTLLLLIAAITGDDWKRIYETALANEYRFLSYGDSSLLFI